MSSLWADLKFGCRVLRGDVLHSIFLVLIICVSVGTNVAILGLVRGVILRPLAVDDLHQIHRLYIRDARGGQLLDASHSQYLALNAAHGDRLLGYAGFTSGISADGGAWIVRGQVVSANFLAVLGIRPFAGRGFDTERPGGAAAPEVLISHALWQTRFQSRSEILDAGVTLSGRHVQVAGILPPGFKGLNRSSPADLWITLEAAAALAIPAIASIDEESSWLELAARIDATEDARVVAARLSAAIADHAAPPSARSGRRRDTVALVPADTVIVHPRIDRRWHQLMLSCMVVAGLVVVVACSNLAGALTSRAAARRKEIGIRRALGAGRWRIVRQLLTESALLICLGGAGGLLAGVWTARIAGAQVSRVLPFDTAVQVAVPFDMAAGLSALAVCAVTCLICALLPAIRSSQLRARSTGQFGDLDSLGRWQTTRAMHLLIVPQAAISIVLLFAAALFITTAKGNLAKDFGYSRSDRAFVTLDLGLHGYDEARGRQFYAAAAEAAGHIPGVGFAGVSGWPLIGESATRAGIRSARGSDSGVLIARAYGVAPGLLESAGLRMVQGRFLRVEDIGRTVVLVDQFTARTIWPGDKAVGQLLRVEFGDRVGGEGQLFEIVGVVGNVRDAPEGRKRARLYFDSRRRYQSRMNVYVSGTGRDDTLVANLRDMIRSLDARVVPLHAMSMEEYAVRLDGPSALAGTALSVFGLFALMITATGIFSVVDRAARQRRFETGVRIAMGASRMDVIRTLATRSGMMLVSGVILGLAGAMLSSRILTSYLGESSSAPAILTVVTAVVLLTGIAGAAIPIKTAVGLDPGAVLREE